MSTGRKNGHKISFTGLEEILKLMLSNYNTFLPSDRPVIDGEFIAVLGILLQCNSIDCLKFLLFCSFYSSILVLGNITQ